MASITTPRVSQQSIPFSVGKDELNWSRAIEGGLLGTLFMTPVFYFVPRVLAMAAIDVARVLGTTLLYDSPSAFGAGMMMHFAIGAGFALGYAALLRVFRGRRPIEFGLLFGVGIWLLGPMLSLAWLMELHPLVRAGEMQTPGLFMLKLREGLKPAFVELLAHLVYGGTLGDAYRRRSKA